jgi:hypothetical protein
MNEPKKDQPKVFNWAYIVYLLLNNKLLIGTLWLSLIAFVTLLSLGRIDLKWGNLEIKSSSCLDEGRCKEITKVYTDINYEIEAINSASQELENRFKQETEVNKQKALEHKRNKIETIKLKIFQLKHYPLISSEDGCLVDEITITKVKNNYDTIKIYRQQVYEIVRLP